MQIIGQTQTGEWLLRLDSGDIMSFATQQEATMAMGKLGTAAAIVQCVQTLAPAMDVGPDLWQEYWDARNADGDFTDEDVAALGISAADLASCVTLLENLKKFFGNEAVSSDAYRVVVNKVRRVSAQV